jgi:hypothetical protein
MDQLQKMVFTATITEAQAEARVHVLEGVIADFFRLYRALEDPAALKDGLSAMSDKLLAMQASALDARESAGAMIGDFKRAMAERATTTEGTEKAAEEPTD